MRTRPRWPTALVAAVVAVAVDASADDATTPVRPSEAPPPPAASAASAAPSAAPEYKERTVGLFFNPVAIAFGFIGAEVDYNVVNHLSLNGQGSVFFRDEYGGSWLGFDVGAGAQFFPLAQTFHGLYVYPRADYAQIRLALDGVDVVANSVGVGATAGWQWGWDCGLALRLGAGAEYYFSWVASNSLNVSSALSGAGLALDLAIGWLF